MPNNILRQKVLLEESKHLAVTKMRKISGIALQFLLILAAFFSSVAAKTEAGKIVLCVEHEEDNFRTIFVVIQSCLFTVAIF